MGEGRAREDCSLKAPCCRSCARYVWMQTGIKGQPGEPPPQTTAVPSSRRETLESPFSPNPGSRSPTLSRSPRETPFSPRLRQPEPHSHPGSYLLLKTPAARAPRSHARLGRPGRAPFPENPAVPSSQAPTLSRSRTPWPQAPASRPSLLLSTPH